MIKAIVTDIEGTTSSLSFVKDVLFPYARQHMPAFIRAHQHDAEVKVLLDDVRHLVALADDVEGLIAQLIVWIDQDQKVTPLKSLQGLIWQHGYQQGDFKGHVYADAYQQLQAWWQQGIALYVYSSGSVQAQKLLFGFSEFGDLTPLFSGYFDTHIGGKKEATSYTKIVEQIQLPAEQVLFLSDIEDELNAAQQVGLQTYWLVRDQASVTPASHRQTLDFNGVIL